MDHANVSDENDPQDEHENNEGPRHETTAQDQGLHNDPNILAATGQARVIRFLNEDGSTYDMIDDIIDDYDTVQDNIPIIQ